MTKTAPTTLTIKFPDPLDDARAFDAWTGADDLASRTVARMVARGLDITWTGADERWDCLPDKVGGFTPRGVAYRKKFVAHIDIQGFTADDTEVIVRVRVSRWGKGKPEGEVLVGAYVGGGLDAFGKYVEPSFLCDPRNHPSVRAARSALGLE